MHEGVCTFAEFLTRFRRVLPCQLIMTPWKEVQGVRGANGREVKEQATELMNTHQYSCVPLTKNNTVEGLYLRFNLEDQPEYKGAEPSHFYRSDRDVISLLRHMRDEERIAIVVGDAENPEGLVTYADFSKRPARVILFAVVAEVEYLLARAIDRVHPDDGWLELIEETDKHGRNPREELAQRKASAKQWDSIMPLTTFAEIGHLVGVVERSQDVVRLLGEDDKLPSRLRSLPDLRNSVAHVVRPVIAGPKRIKTVANQVDLMFQWIERWEKRLASDRREGIGG